MLHTGSWCKFKQQTSPGLFMVSVIFLFCTFTLKSFYGKKPLQYCKVINLQLIKINEKNF